MNFSIQGNLVDIVNKRIYPARISVIDQIVTNIEETSVCENYNYILPPFVDSHIHFESSMLTPAEFARTAAIHGTVGIVSDPHEIANVLGKPGIRYFVDNAKQVPLKIYFGIPSCVPATNFETSGAIISSEDVKELFEKDNLAFLGEMMNFPGVINEDTEVIKKINIAKSLGKAIDGHCPLLKNDDLKKYISTGISTDHEATTLEEAIEKLKLGMHILIRNGSAAKDFEQLHPIIDLYPNQVMFCSDDLEANSLLKGHINLIVKAAIAKGCNLMNVLRAASFNPIKHYKMDIGMLQTGDKADFVVIDNLTDFSILKTYCNGKPIAESSKSYIKYIPPLIVNNFHAEKIKPHELDVEANNVSSANQKKIEVNVIGITKNKLLTKLENHFLPLVDKKILTDTSQDISKLVVLNRYIKSKPAIAFVRGLQLGNIAIASSIAHDSHNIIASGYDNDKLCRAINSIIDAKGGISVAYKDEVKILQLPIAGLISDLPIDSVSKLHNEITDLIKELGCTLDSPFMTLSFLALLVIPEIKLSDKGLFDSINFRFINNEVVI